MLSCFDETQRAESLIKKNVLSTQTPAINRVVIDGEWWHQAFLFEFRNMKVH